MRIIKYILLSTLLTSTFHLSISQQPSVIGSCGTDDLEAITERLKNNKEAVEQGILNDRGGNIYYAPIKWHLVSRSDGSGRIQEQDVFEQMCELNELYAAFDMQFYLKDDAFQYLFSTPAFTDPVNNTDLFSQFRDNNAINIYVCETANTPGTGVTLAYYSPANDWVVTRKDMVEQLVPNVIPHEVGHYFSLLHPFNGWDSDPWDPAIHGNPVTLTTAPSRPVNVERVARTNCGNAGDFLCDTPADYNLGFGWSGCTPYNGGCRDANNDLLMPMQENVMGYFFACGNYEFTNQQINIMIADYLSSGRSQIRDNSFFPDDDDISGFVIGVAPQDGSTTQYFDEVTIEWTEAPGATRYFVEVATDPTFNFKRFRGFVRANTLTLENLFPETTYYWRVKPVNDIVYCNPYTAARSFTTPDRSVAVNEIESLEKWTLMPNPVKPGVPIQIDIESSRPIEGSLRLINTSGQVIREQQIEMSSGSQVIWVNTSNLPSGLYWTVLDTKNGRAYQRVVVQ